MRNLATLKSTIVVAIALLCVVFTSCVEETLYKIEKEQVEISNNLTVSYGKINTAEENALDLEISLAQDTILVEEFSELALASADLQFSDSQEASLTNSAKGDAYKVEKISYRDYSVEDYSINRRKITLNFAVKYSFDGEVRDTVLSPWYFQETPTVVIPQEPEKVHIISYVPRHTISNNEKGSITAALFIDKMVNDIVDTTYKAVVTLSKVGSVSGMEIYTPSNACTKADMQCDTLSVSEKVVKDHFTLTVEERLYRWETTFISTTGGDITPKNEIKFVLTSKVVFSIDDYRYVWSFNGSSYDVVRRIEDKGLEGKMIQGKFSPYLGTYVLKVNSYLFSPQVPELDGSTPFHSSVAEHNIYQRESVV